MKKLNGMRFLKKIVIFSITMCVIFLPYYTLCLACDIQISDTMITAWYGMFGTELAVFRFVKILETIKIKKDKNESEE